MDLVKSQKTSNFAPEKPLVDPFQRQITYLRLSVTDRCDFRCFYCMSENMTFLPKTDVLSLEELTRLCSVFVKRGITKLRISGGEPLVRRDIMTLFQNLSGHLENGALQEVTLTTNGSQLARFAKELYACGVRRINVSLDTLDADKFTKITRWGRLEQVLNGIDAAQAAGLHIKINTVALRDLNEDELPHIIEWAHGRGFDNTLIETMPMGEIGSDRTDHYLALSEFRKTLEAFWTLEPSSFTTGGPSRYMRIKETGGLLGFITPLSHNFCESCNRVRLTCTGQLFPCLGQEDVTDLRRVLRETSDEASLNAAIERAIDKKPKGHDFIIDRDHKKPAVSRHMSVTGG